MKFSFDENDDLVLENIPDDMMDTVSTLARDREINDEDMWREILTKWARELPA